MLVLQSAELVNFHDFQREGGPRILVDVPVIMQLKFQQSVPLEKVKVPQVQFLDRLLEHPVVPQRWVRTVETVQKNWRFHSSGRLVADVFVNMQRRVPVISGDVRGSQISSLTVFMTISTWADGAFSLHFLHFWASSPKESPRRPPICWWSGLEVAGMPGV